MGDAVAAPSIPSEKQMPALRSTAQFLCAALAVGLAPSCTSAQSNPAHSPSILSFANVTGVSPLPTGVDLRDGPLLVRITALRDDVLRIRAARTGVLPEDASWAVLPAARAASSAVTQEE